MKFITLIFISLFSVNIWAGKIIINDAHLKLNPPTMNMSVAFLKITNNTDKEISLINVKGDFAKEFEIHEMIMNNGTMKMRPVSPLKIPAHQTIELKNGGYHIMIFGLKKPLIENKTYKLILNFNQNQKIETLAQAIRSI